MLSSWREKYEPYKTGSEIRVPRWISEISNTLYRLPQALLGVEVLQDKLVLFLLWEENMTAIGENHLGTFELSGRHGSLALG